MVQDPMTLVICQEDPGMWFSKSEYRTSLAKELCSECWFKDKCLELAITNEEVHGVWGGVNFSDPEERISSTVKKCRKGHTLPPEGGNCYTCRRNSQKKYDKRTRRNYHRPKIRKNVLGEYCSNDHLLTEDNTYILPNNNALMCKDCLKNNRRKKYLPSRAYSKAGDFR